MAAESAPYDDVRLDLGALAGAVLARAIRIVFLTVILLVIAYAVLLFVPRVYESGAAILVEQRENAFNRAADDAVTPSMSADATLMSSQIELIKSRDTLLNVVDSEGLRSLPEFNGGAGGPMGALMRLLGRGVVTPETLDEVVLNNLNDRLTVVQERDSRLISVLVRSEDPVLAARLANAIAAAHVARRADLSISDTAEATVWLEQQIDQLRLRVNEAEAAVAAYRVENDLFTGGNNTSLLDQQLSNIATQITSAQERRSTAQSRATLIRGLLDAGQPIDGVDDVRNSAVVQQLTEERARLTGERAQLLATLLSNHPNVRGIEAQIAELNRQVAIEGRRVADALDAEARIEAGIETSLQEELARLKLSASTATRDGVELAALEREATAQRALLETYLLRYRDASARTDSNSALPDVRVVTEAAPAVSPASPRTAMILIVVAIVSVVGQVGSILIGELASGRVVVERRPTASEAPFVEPEATYDEPEIFSDLADPSDYPGPVGGPEPDVEQSPPERRQSRLEALQNAFVGALRRREAFEEIAATSPEQQQVQTSSSREPTTDQMAVLVSDLALGRVRAVMLAATDRAQDCVDASHRIIAEMRARGISVARVDACTMRPTSEAGLTDLASNLSGFGSVVHKVGDTGHAEVPWGQQATLDRRSSKPLTLVEALADIYEVVVVVTGRIGIASTLPLFAGLPARLVVIDSLGGSALDAARSDAAALGFADIQLVNASIKAAEVA